MLATWEHSTLGYRRFCCHEADASCINLIHLNSSYAICIYEKYQWFYINGPVYTWPLCQVIIWQWEISMCININKLSFWQVVKVLHWDQLVTGEDTQKKVVHCCSNILAQVVNDPVYKVYLACLVSWLLLVLPFGGGNGITVGLPFWVILSVISS